MRFAVPTAVTVENTCHVGCEAVYGLVDLYQLFRRSCFLHLEGGWHILFGVADLYTLKMSGPELR